VVVEVAAVANEEEVAFHMEEAAVAAEK